MGLYVTDEIPLAVLVGVALHENGNRHPTQVVGVTEITLATRPLRFITAGVLETWQVRTATPKQSEQ